MALDSAQRFNQDNYRGRILEVSLGKASKIFDSLNSALVFASRRGYTPERIGLLNVARGESARNEPTEAIFLTQYRGTRNTPEESLIIQENGNPLSYAFYSESGFRFIP
ncbi:hypothetical protein HY449_04710 [Candidatus Pacearchaeota archaeon]|nr:hypothetical protein [Candidatus Pacearchaeota archaeon]